MTAIIILSGGIVGLLLNLNLDINIESLIKVVLLISGCLIDALLFVNLSTCNKEMNKLFNKIESKEPK